jgi:peptide/nickel transport system substrate-binding protein
MSSAKQRILLSMCVSVAAALVGAPGTSTAAPEGNVTLTVGLLQDIDSPNPAAGFLVSSYEVWNLQYATLTDKAAADFATIPGLAESWTALDDGLSYTYRLREGLRWSDGEPLTADDVAFTINTSRDQEWINHSAVTVNLTATAVDDRTVTVTSSVPDPKLPTMDVYILPEHIWGDLSADELPTYEALDGVGSGPFTLEEWKSGQSWTMVANSNYWGGRPAVDRVVFRVFTNPDAMVAALRTGEIDAAHDIPPSALQLLTSDAGITTVAGGQGGFTELAMNGMAGGLGDGHPALLDVDVRRAVAHAIDRAILFDRVLLGIGREGVTLSVSPDTKWQPTIPVEDQFLYDPEKAKALLDAGGYLDTDGDGVREMPGGGRPLNFRYEERSESEKAPAVRDLITGWLAAVGIATTVNVVDDAQLTDVIASGEYDLFVWGWSPFVDPDTMLSYFVCDQLTTDIEAVGYNDANWCDPEYDELYAQQKVELDPVKRVAIVHEMLRLFHDRSTYVVLFEDATLQAYRNDRFTGWLQQPAETGPVLFTNSSPTYVNLRPIGGTEVDGGVSNVVLIGVLAVSAAMLIGGVAVYLRSRSSRDDRE